MSKSIRLSEEAYERLAAHKGEDEEADTVREAVAERRERRGEELDDIADSMREA